MKPPAIMTGLLFLLCLAPAAPGAVDVSQRIQTNIFQLPQPPFYANQIVPSPSRGFYVTFVEFVSHPGETVINSYLTIRYDTRGRGVWTNVINAMTNTFSPPVIAPDRRGSVVIAGASDLGFDVSKYSASGHRVWSIRHRLPSDVEWKCDLAVDSSGSVAVGYSSRTLIPTQNELVRYNAHGERLWGTRLGISFDDIQTDLVGNVYALGRQAQSDCDGPYEQVLVKITRTGIPVWTNVIPQAFSGRMVVDSSGRPLVACATLSAANLIKYGRGGTLLWTNRYDQFGGLEALAVDSEGAAYLYVVKFDPNSFSLSRVVVKSSPGGRVRWSAEIPLVGGLATNFLPGNGSPRFGQVNRRFATLVQDIVNAGQYDTATATFRER